jgi:hypothetical protein
MTALCGGGTSSPQSGVADVVLYTSGLIAVILQNRGYGWLTPVIPLLSFPPVVLTSFCATDPPAQPTFTTAETEAMLKLEFGADMASGLAKMRDLILNAAWYLVCQCDVGSPTAIGAPQTPPAGTPLTPTFTTTSPTPCLVDNQGDVAISGGAAQYTVPQPDLRSLSAGTIVIDCRYTDIGGTTSRPTQVQTVFTAHTGGTVADLFNVVWPAGADELRIVYPMKPTYGFVKLNVTCPVTSTNLFGHTFTVYCGVAPGDVPGAEPCPIDLVARGMLEQILSMVTLIQRQAVPFSYVYGDNHAALSGNGSIAVQGLIGVSVDVTTLPASYGRSAGTPEQLHELGFVTLGTADGWTSSRRIDHDGTLLLPTGAGAFTSIGYTLEPGVVVAIRELVREP